MNGYYLPGGTNIGELWTSLLLLSGDIDRRQATLNGRSVATKKCMGTMSTSSVRRDGSKGVKPANAAETRQTSISAKEQCHVPASKFRTEANRELHCVIDD
jgi:hypothetical protein